MTKKPFAPKLIGYLTGSPWSGVYCNLEGGKPAMYMKRCDHGHTYYADIYPGSYYGRKILQCFGPRWFERDHEAEERENDPFARLPLLDDPLTQLLS